MIDLREDNNNSAKKQCELVHFICIKCPQTAPIRLEGAIHTQFSHEVKSKAFFLAAN